MIKLKRLGFHTTYLIAGMLLSFTAQTTGLSKDASAVALLPLVKPQGKVILTLDGLITHTNADGQALFDLAMIQQLPTSTVYTSTVVTDGVKRFDGILVRDLFSQLGLSKQAQYVDATALNDYLVQIPIADFYDYDVLLATHMDGVLLQPTDKGPLWVVYPRDKRRKLQDIRYDYRWVWQLKHLHIR